MNMSIENKEYINTILNDTVLNWLYPVLESGQVMCREFIKTNQSFFDCDEYLNVLPGTLLTYCISKQMKNQCLLTDSPFELVKEEINNRNGYAIPILKIENINISLMRSAQRWTIENVNKKYLIDKCSKNISLDHQIRLFDLDWLSDDPYHGVLLYGVDKLFEEINFADIVFFDRNLKAVRHSLNLIQTVVKKT